MPGDVGGGVCGQGLDYPVEWVFFLKGIFCSSGYVVVFVVLVGPSRRRFI